MCRSNPLLFPLLTNWRLTVDVYKRQPEQVTDAVRRLLDICALDGGYIFDVNTTIDHGVKHENVLAMFDAVKTYGKY